jgi:hypothetical protein
LHDLQHVAVVGSQGVFSAPAVIPTQPDSVEIKASTRNDLNMGTRVYLIRGTTA